MADVGPFSRGVRDSVERRVPRVFFGLVLGEEREVLPPHVARELRDVFLVADAEVHGVPPKPEVRMVLRVVFLVQCLRFHVQFYFRGLRRFAAAARSVADDLDEFNRSPEDRLVLGGLRLAVRGVYREISTAELAVAPVAVEDQNAGLLEARRCGFTDDCSLAEAAGFKITMIDGAKQLMKLTDADDFAMLSFLVASDRAAQGFQQKTDDNRMTETRLGTGFDVHKFSDEAGPIWLGGIKLESDRRMLAHSDGDVGLHALCDAILGSIADGDIGAHFLPSDPQWQNADSAIFLDFAIKRVLERGGRVMNLDLTFICETPKINPHRDAMRHRIAEICGISIDRVSVKATTSERLGFTGRGEGIAAQAIASITLPTPSDQSLPDSITK